MPTVDPVVVSCPGKVLIAGGYLVLDRSHQGFVISTPSRFYTVVQEEETSSAHTTSSGVTGEGEKRVKLSVRSPQFDDGLWEYEALKRDGEWMIDQVDSQGSANPFVRLSLQATLKVATAINPEVEVKDLLITIVGSNDFYSQSRDDLTPIPFAPLNCTIKNVHKTGLGSSAAMVTSLTSSLFLHWTSPQSSSDPSPETVQLMHNLAQYVHSLAQGKIGSGFDVSAAVYGSQVYKRFDVKCLGDLLEGDKNAENKISSQSLLSVLSPSLNPLWTSPSSSANVSPFSLPPHLTLLLADVDAGSNTPSMVGKVMAWKKAQPEESERVWGELSRANEELREVFEELRRESEGNGEYGKRVEELSRVKAEEWSSSSSSTSFSKATTTILRIRKLMREMGEASSVPIEPPSQTKLLDAVSEIEGVVGAGVPGAGGFDAIWVLCLTPPSSSTSTAESTPLEKVERLLKSWTEMSVRPLSQNAWTRGTESGDGEGSERGLVREKLGEVEGLREAVERVKAQTRK
ncbi:phosphomevalonate kinase [Sporobolomyces salmoneus]|uniref:phosphomevalonate kinase n=1 Tax=Sporobolomyces salmoneus TaxID=183962 RepID=UPI003180B97F